MLTRQSCSGTAELRQAVDDPRLLSHQAGPGPTAIRTTTTLMTLRTTPPWFDPARSRCSQDDGGASGTAMRQPGTLSDPSKPAGTVNDAMPFDHIIVVMMENHSFDNLLGQLPRQGSPRRRADLRQRRHGGQL
jgi:phospholipase C